MRIFKNFKTKKQLKEEIERLKCVSRVQIPIRLHEERKNIHKLKASSYIPYIDRNMPEDLIKRGIAMKLSEELIPFINYSSCNREYGKVHTGTLLVVDENDFLDE